MIADRIHNLLAELSSYHHSKVEVMYRAVASRLDKSLTSYEDELTDSIEYLKNRKPEKLMRKLNK